MAGISSSFTLLACEQAPARRAEKKLAESEVAKGRLHDPIACEQARTKKKNSPSAKQKSERSDRDGTVRADWEPVRRLHDASDEILRYTILVKRLDLFSFLVYFLCC